MLEIIISVALYAAAVTLLIKGVIVYEAIASRQDSKIIRIFEENSSHACCYPESNVGLRHH